MVSLTDIAPSTENVTVGGASIPVYGVSAKGIASLFARFPILKDALTEGKSVKTSPEALMTLVPDAIAAIIAAGTGSPGDPKAEEIAGKLGVDTQLEFMEKILRLTMPKGVGPFVERLSAVMGRLDVDGDSGKEPDTKSPPPLSH